METCLKSSHEWLQVYKYNLQSGFEYSKHEQKKGYTVRCGGGGVSKIREAFQIFFKSGLLLWVGIVCWHFI